MNANLQKLFRGTVFNKAGTLACFILSLLWLNPAFAIVTAQSALVPAGRTEGVFPIVKYEYAINVVHYTDNSPLFPCTHGKTFLLVHGFGDNGGLFEPLARQLVTSGKACHVYTLDLPAHGASTVSTDAYFGPRIWGTINIAQDYVKVVDQILATMHAQGVKIDTIVGHSTGGLIIQLLQDKYSKQLSSIKAKFGIDNTILIASDIPGALSWASGDAPIAAGYAKGLVVSLASNNAALPQQGTLVPLSYQTYIALKFAVNGQAVSGAPTPTEAHALNDAEPYAAAANIVGLDPTGATTNSVPRLPVKPGLWSGMNLTVIWPSQDLFFMQSEMDALAGYLKPATQAIQINDAEAIHAIHYTKPQLLLPYFK